MTDLNLIGASTYSQVLLNRDRCLSLILEGSLRDAIQASTSGLGVDHAVQMVWPQYRSSTRGWSPQSPNSEWLVTEDRCLQTVHVNLLDGSVLVDGKPIGNKLPKDVTQDSTYNKLFRVCGISISNTN